MIIKKSERKKHSPHFACTSYEYEHGDKDIDIAFIELRGRHPEKGIVISKVSKEIIFVSKGGGKVGIDGKEFLVNEGDAILILPNKKYFLEGNMDLIFSCHPPWNPDNYKYSE